MRNAAIYSNEVEGRETGLVWLIEVPEDFSCWKFRAQSVLQSAKPFTNE